MKASKIAAAVAGILALAVGGTASATTFTVHAFGDASSTSNGYQAVTNGSDYGGVAINPSAGFTLADLLEFSFDYDMVEGNAVTGTPRIFLYCTGTIACDSGGQAAAVYTLEYAGVTEGDTGNTGNIVTSSATDAGPNGIGFGNCAGSAGQSLTFANFVTCAGSGTEISQFGIVLDGSASQMQTLDVSNIIVNGQNLTAVPEPGELGLTGFGLLLIGGLAWRSRKKDRRANSRDVDLLSA